MYRVAGPKTIRLDKVGDLLEMNCSDLSDLRGWIQLFEGSLTGLVIGFKFSCEPTGEGLFFEPDTGYRLSSMTGIGAVSAAAINCKGFARVRMEVLTAASTADSIGSFRMCSYTEVTMFGFVGRERSFGYV